MIKLNYNVIGLLANCLLLVFFVSCSISKPEGIIGEWYSPNRIVKITFLDNHTTELRTIEDLDNPENEKWDLVNDSILILGKDTLLYLRDTVFLHYTYFTKNNDMSGLKASKENFIGSKYVWKSSIDESIFTNVHFIDDSSYFEKGLLNQDTLPRKWDLILFEGYYYLKVQHAIKGVDTYLKVKERTDTTFHLEYYDFGSNSYYNSVLIQK